MLKRFINLIHPLKKNYANKTLVGVDIFQNRYYQCYDESGNPTHRLIKYGSKADNDEMGEGWQSWLLKKTNEVPHTERIEELQKVEDYLKKVSENNRRVNYQRYQFNKGYIHSLFQRAKSKPIMQADHLVDKLCKKRTAKGIDRTK